MKREFLALLAIAGGAISLFSLIKSRGNNEKGVKIVIVNDSSGGARVGKAPPYVTVTKNKNKIRWEVENDSSLQVNVLVDGFHRTDPPDPVKVRPFGPDATDNRFDFETIDPGDESRLISKKGKGEGPPQLRETYKYTITVRWGAAGEFLLDPHVVFAD